MVIVDMAQYHSIDIYRHQSSFLQVLHYARSEKVQLAMDKMGLLCRYVAAMLRPKTESNMKRKGLSPKPWWPSMCARGCSIRNANEGTVLLSSGLLGVTKHLSGSVMNPPSMAKTVTDVWSARGGGKQELQFGSMIRVVVTISAIEYLMICDDFVIRKPHIPHIQLRAG